MYKLKFAIAVGSALLLGAASASYAADKPTTGSTTSTNPTHVPLSQGVTSVNSNLAKDPDNKGLQNASEKLEANQTRIAEKRADQAEKREDTKHKAKHTDKKSDHQKVEHPDKVEHPEKAERPAR